MNWLLKIIFGTVSELLLGIVEVFASVMNNIFQVMYDLNKALKFDKLSSYLVSLALAIVTCFAIKQMLEVYVFHTEGDEESEPLEIITRLVITISIIVCGSFVLNELIKLAGTITNEVSNTILPNQKTFEEIADSVLKSILGSTTIAMFVALMSVTIIIIAFIIFLFQAAKRGAELMLLDLLLPIVAIDLLTTNRERWNSFIHELLLVVFGYIIQIISFNIFLVIFSQISKNILDFKYIIASISWIILIINVPKWLEKFTYSSGISNSLKGGIKNMSYIVPKFIGK